MPGSFGNLLERVAVDDLHDVGQSGRLDVRGGFLRALRVVLDRHDAAAGFARAETEPDAAVAARRADLEDRLGATRGDEHAQKAAVLFRDRELSLVGGLDLLEDRLDVRRQRSGRSLLCAPMQPATRRDADHADEDARMQEFYVTSAWRADTYAAARAAVARASAMQSGMPMARKPLPVTNTPGSEASWSSIAATR